MAWGDKFERMETSAEAKAAREQDEVNAAAYLRKQNEIVMAFYDLSDEEWDALPKTVQEKLHRVYQNI